MYKRQGYGYEFHNPIDGGTRGASEYKDVKAAGLWLKDQNYIDQDRIYVYGGSYGGYLTAMALGRDSQLFSGGVDIHGVHDRTLYGYLNSINYEKAPDYELARKLLPNGRGSMIAFGIKGGKDAGVAFINNVTLASHLANVGDTRTLVIHPASGTHSQMDEATLKFAGLSHDMIRLSVGIEDIDDIKNDFEAGFRAARKPRLVSNQ